MPKRGTYANPIYIQDGPARKQTRRPSSRSGYQNRRVSRVRANTRTGGFLGLELKFLDTVRERSALAAGPTGGELDPATVNCINAVTQGDGESQRDGRAYIIKSVNVKGYAELQNSASLDATAQIFIALVHDKQTNGAQLSAEDVFLMPSTTTPANQPLAQPFMNLQYKNRFTVLATKVISMDPGNWNGTNFASVRKPFNLYKALNIKVNCNGTTGNVSDITDSSLHVVAFTDNNAASPVVSYNSRIRFMG